MSGGGQGFDVHWSAADVLFSGLEAAAAELADALPRRGVVALQGEMGAGKTTTVAALCKVWGVREGVSSPTFSLVQTYLPPRDLDAGFNASTPVRIHHLDLYRIEHDSELNDLDLEGLFEDDALVFIEWPERAADRLDAGAWLLKIGIEPDGGRNFQLLRRCR
jgi:tRNA threonylcarbamoyladenosine biosynthesis protein TsaE